MNSDQRNEVRDFNDYRTVVVIRRNNALIAVLISTG